MTPASVARPAAVASTRPRYLALCARHTEPLVAAELLSLPDVADVEVRTGAVSFSGPLGALYRANLYSRCASRILRVLGDYPCEGPAELYDAVRRLPWEAKAILNRCNFSSLIMARCLIITRAT